MNLSFEDFVSWRPSDPISPGTEGGGAESALWLKSHREDPVRINPITKEEIDTLAAYPELKAVCVTGLSQETFEYFVGTYGKQLKGICFWKNKLVRDWSLLGKLSGLEYLFWFHNQRIDALWNMSGNEALKGICLYDFSRLHTIRGIEKARQLEFFSIGNEVWPRMELESLMPLRNRKLTHLDFSGKKLCDPDLSFLDKLPQLQSFGCPGNLFTTAQLAWICANYPQLEKSSLGPKMDFTDPDGTRKTVILGKQKPVLSYEQDGARIRKYEADFAQFKQQYKGMSYHQAFPAE